MKRVRRLAALALALAASLSLAGCGFQPLYGDLGVSQNLAAIEVVENSPASAVEAAAGLQ